MDESKLFYIKLKEQRESRNFSLEEISDFTKIDIKYLIAIEEGNFSCLPNVYLRLFLRSYCKYIKADTTKALNDYEFHTLGTISSVVTPTNVLDEKEVEPQSSINEDDLNLSPVTKSQIITIVTTIIMLGIVFYLINSITGSNDSIETQVIEEESVMSDNLNEPKDGIVSFSPIPNEEKLTNKEFPEGNFIVKATESLNIDSPYTFTIKALTKTKINVNIDNFVINEILKPEESISRPVNSLVEFDIWSAAHVDCRLNDIDLNSFFGREEQSIRGSFETQNKIMLYWTFNQYQY